MCGARLQFVLWSGTFVTCRFTHAKFRQDSIPSCEKSPDRIIVFGNFRMRFRFFFLEIFYSLERYFFRSWKYRRYFVSFKTQIFYLSARNQYSRQKFDEISATVWENNARKPRSRGLREQNKIALLQAIHSHMHCKVRKTNFSLQR